MLILKINQNIRGIRHAAISIDALFCTELVCGLLGICWWVACNLEVAFCESLPQCKVHYTFYRRTTFYGLAGATEQCLDVLTPPPLTFCTCRPQRRCQTSWQA